MEEPKLVGRDVVKVVVIDYRYAPNGELRLGQGSYLDPTEIPPPKRGKRALTKDDFRAPRPTN